MKSLFTAIAFLALWSTVSAAAPTEAPLGLVPRPAQVERLSGQFELKADTPIAVDKDSADGMNVARQLAERLQRSTGLALKPAAAEGADSPKGAIRITAAGGDVSPGNEGYQLEVTPGGVVIAARGGPGMLYGAQTFLQLLPPEVFGPGKPAAPVTWAAPAVRITDRPRFGWRGLLLDVSRHFFTKEELKNYIDLMAQHKLNTLHLHLTDDVGWRLQIKRYPKLIEIGAWRKDIGFGLDPKSSTAYDAQGRYGGFYTQDDVRELVAYAKDRSVTIVPEIEMPGHAGGALLAYPELSCHGYKGRGMGIFCPGNEAAFEFLQNVLSEVIPLFPGKYIHIGGDEVDKGNWRRCEKCKARMAAEGLKSPEELQSYFIKRIEKFINGQGRTLIGWDEILEGGLAPNATVMSWRDPKLAVAAANSGHDVVMTPTSHCYFDYYQGPPKAEPKAIGGFIPLRQVYDYEPVVPGIAADKARHVLGIGGNLWSEFFPNYPHVQYMTYPRACALAEVAWSAPQPKDWEDFKRRLALQLKRLDAQGARYRPPRPGDPGF